MCFHCRNWGFYFIYFFPSWKPHLPYKSQSSATEHSHEMGCLIHRCVWHSGSLLLYVEADCRVNLVRSLSDGLSDHDYYTFLKLSKIKHRKWNKQTKINKEKIVKWMKICSCGLHIWMISCLKKKEDTEYKVSLATYYMGRSHAWVGESACPKYGKIFSFLPYLPSQKLSCKGHQERPVLCDVWWDKVPSSVISCLDSSAW